ncbi:MAG: hypothetical protein HY392_04555 [Candidatus Diapherotrites archaeon]|nr:hypothetical protein [Candidatus Diapherotrites archaeon]
MFSKRYRKARKVLLNIFEEFEKTQRFRDNSLIRNEDYPPQVLRQLKAFGLIGGDVHYTGYFSLSSRGAKIANLLKYWKDA